MQQTICNFTKKWLQICYFLVFILSNGKKNSQCSTQLLITQSTFPSMQIPTQLSDLVMPCSVYMEMQSEINFLGRISHPNLVKLLGYCRDDEEFLLVYEFMPRGSLENHLFRSMNLRQLIKWTRENYWPWFEILSLKSFSLFLFLVRKYRITFLEHPTQNRHWCGSRLGILALLREDSHIQRFQGLQYTTWWGQLFLATKFMNLDTICFNKQTFATKFSAEKYKIIFLF